MTTHLYVDRIADQGTLTFTPVQVAEVLGCNIKNAYRLLREERIPHTKESVGYNDPAEKHEGRKFRREATLGGMLIHIINISVGDKTDLLDAVRQRLPSYYKMCRDYVAQKEAPLAAGVVDARDAFTAPTTRKRKRKSHTLKPLGKGDEYQPDFFDTATHLTSHPALIRA